MMLWAKGPRFPPMIVAHFPSALRNARPGPVVQLMLVLGLALILALAMIGPDRLLAQIEGDRGIIPVATTHDIEASGIEVDTTGKTAQEAREAGWKEAQRKAWAQLKGPEMGDGQLAAMVSAVVIEHEQIGPHRYIASLGVIFDRARAGQYVGSGSDGARAHSAPMLVLPVLYSGGTAQVFEVRGAWQKAWAEWRTGASVIDYVRPSGAGGQSLQITAGQPGRRSRSWWRNVLDQFGAADVLIPVARLERQWPGGPVRGTFTARYGPDDTFLESFTLSANDEAGVPAMLGQALVRFDQIYSGALAGGLLRPDPTLVTDRPQIDAALAAIIDAGKPRPVETERKPASDSPAPGPESSQSPVSTFSVQFSSPDAAAVDAAVASVRGASGVQSASTTSLAIGGTSVMRVSTSGDLAELAAALRSRGWQVVVGAGALSIRK